MNRIEMRLVSEIIDSKFIFYLEVGRCGAYFAAGLFQRKCIAAKRYFPFQKKEL